ncbi:MAG TPA: amidohydrolase family protein [Thermoplasmata archaeon]|nr:amidohydrolase family protein [Thermoplasmata archaeon]
MAAAPPPERLAIENATIYPAPGAPALSRGIVVVHNGRIESVGTGLPIPSGTTVVPGDGRFLVAGFWNAHVHFTQPCWRSAATAPAARLEEPLRAMLTSRGFTSVVDTGSDPRSTLAIRRRIDSHELPGPRIWTAGSGLYPPHGLPYYVRDEIPFWVRWLIPQPRSPAAAVRAVERNFAYGADLVKLFTGSYVARGTVKHMPEPIARAAAAAAHRRGRLVFSHPSDLEGTRVALAAGVDVLAHPPDSTDGVDPSLLRALVERRTSIVPTLKMFATTVTRSPSYLEPIYRIVREFRALGGELLFGTDVGYMSDYSTEEEFRALASAGVGPSEVLEMLTTAPARRFGVAAETGTIARGQAADLVLLDDDPMQDVAAFARVRATIRGGRVLYLRS